jgi:hypothetical protein
MECIDQIESNDNQNGICGISANDSMTIVACPHKEKGMLRVHIYEGDAGKDNPI